MYNDIYTKEKKVKIRPQKNKSNFTCLNDFIKDITQMDNKENG